MHILERQGDKRSVKDQLHDVKVCAEYIETHKSSSLDIKDITDLLEMQRAALKQVEEKRRAKKERKREQRREVESMRVKLKELEGITYFP